MMGLRIARRFAPKKGSSEKVVFSGCDFVDFLYQTAWQKAMKHYCDVRKVTVLADASKRGFLEAFTSEHDQALFVSRNDMQNLVSFFRTDEGRLFARRHRELVCALGSVNFRKDLMDAPSWLDGPLMAKSALHVPWELKPLSFTDLQVYYGWGNVHKEGLVVSVPTDCANEISEMRDICKRNALETTLLVVDNDGYPRGNAGCRIQWKEALRLINRCIGVVGLSNEISNVAAMLQKPVLLLGDGDMPDSATAWGDHVMDSSSIDLETWIRRISARSSQSYIG